MGNLGPGIAPRFLWKARCGKRADTASAEAAVMLTGASLLRPHRGRAVAASPGMGPRMGSNVASDSPCPAGAPVLATPPLRDGAKDGVKRGAYYNSGER